MNEIYETCEDCYKKVSIMKMIVKGTQDGNIIYCPECVARHKYLEEEGQKIIDKYGLNITLNEGL
jgi:transcription elongation factor Elf1